MTHPSRPRTTSIGSDEPPLPGTPEARALGCRCPVAEDPDQRADGLVLYFGHCPVHQALVEQLVRRRLGGPQRKTA